MMFSGFFQILEGKRVKDKICLIKNLFEKDTLPHLKIYSKLPESEPGNRSVLHEGMEGRNEVNEAERRVLIKSFAPRYRKKGKKVKGEVLTEFTQMTGYNRCYGAYLLRHQGKRIWLSPKVVAVGDVGKKAGGQRARKSTRKF